MIKPAPPQPRGIAGLALLFCAVALIAGVLLDFALGEGPRFGVIAQPGGRAALGVGVAASGVLIAHALRWVLGRKRRDESGGGDAADHA